MKNIGASVRQRIGSLLTIVFLLAFNFIFEYAQMIGWTLLLQLFAVFFLVLFVLLFIVFYLKTGLWSFFHKKGLDERELEMANKALRISYSIFTVSVLLLLLVFSLSDIIFDIVIVVSLIIFAHILPAAVLSWYYSINKDM